MLPIIKNKKMLKALVIVLELLVLGLVAYLIILPFYPALKYNITSDKNSDINWQDLGTIKKLVEKIANKPDGYLPIADNINNTETSKNNLSVASKNNINNNPINPPIKNEKINRIIIPKIGVNAPIIETADEQYGLDRGAWRVPNSSTPNRGGNMVITGHRFKYLPPNNLTFYLFYKLKIGDIASVIWQEKTYYYRIKEIKIVSNTETSILSPAEESILTIFTCDPIYSTKNRLVVISELIEDKIIN